jgi:hypothetical protein
VPDAAGSEGSGREWGERPAVLLKPRDGPLSKQSWSERMQRETCLVCWGLGAGGLGLRVGPAVQHITSSFGSYVRRGQRKCIATRPKGRRMFIVQCEGEALPALVWPWCGIVAPGMDACWLCWIEEGGPTGGVGVLPSPEGVRECEGVGAEPFGSRLVHRSWALSTRDHLEAAVGRWGCPFLPVGKPCCTPSKIVHYIHNMDHPGLLAPRSSLLPQDTASSCPNAAYLLRYLVLIHVRTQEQSKAHPLAPLHFGLSASLVTPLEQLAKEVNAVARPLTLS